MKTQVAEAPADLRFNLKDTLNVVQNVALQGMKSGQEIGYRDGMLRAIAICEAKAVLHSLYLPPNAYYTDGDNANAATCGRRDECTALAYSLRKEIEALYARQTQEAA